jgi:hypothetical protein
MANLGPIPIPTADTNLVWPLKLEYPLVQTTKPEVATHVFQSGERKITQRFLLGANTRRFTINFGLLPKSRYQSLISFFDQLGGAYNTFLLTEPLPSGGSVQTRVRLSDQSLNLDLVRDCILNGLSLSLAEVPVTFPVYTSAKTLIRFPNSLLQDALLEQVQELIPLVRIIPHTCAAIAVSDRMVTLDGTVYQPRLMDWSGIGQSTDGSSDVASFKLGNVDRVFTQIVNQYFTTNARVEFSLYHTATRYLINLWAGDLSKCTGLASDVVTLQASDGFWQLRETPFRKISRSCWKTPNTSNCPFTGSCSRSWGTCQAKSSFGGINASPETVYLGGYNRAQKDNSFTSSSIVDDNLYGKVLPLVFMQDMFGQKVIDGITQWVRSSLPVSAMISAIRDENEFLTGMGVFSEGPVAEFGYGHTLNGALHHGVGTSNPLDGLRLGYGQDPIPANDRSSDGFEQFFNLSESGTTYAKDGRAAGTAFVEIRTRDSAGKKVLQTSQQQMMVYVNKGICGYTWSAPGVRSFGNLCNHVWVAVNLILRARGVLYSPAAVQEKYFDVDQAIADAAWCEANINRIIQAGAPAPMYNPSTGTSGAIYTPPTTRKRWQFRGIIQDEKPLKDWLSEIMSGCLGGYTFEFGKFKTYIRENSGSVSSFTEGNIIADSLTLDPITYSFNQLTATFGNLELDGVNDSITLSASDHAALLGTPGEPKYLKGDQKLVGCSGRDEAAVWVATRLKEELGGATTDEWLKARDIGLKTTILALETGPGMVCSIQHPDAPINEPDNSTHEFRVRGWRLNKDFSVDITGKSCTDAIYDMLQGPNPADVGPSPMPAIAQPTATATGPASQVTGFRVDPVHYSRDASGGLVYWLTGSWTASTDAAWVAEGILINDVPAGPFTGTTFKTDALPLLANTTLTIEALSVNSQGDWNTVAPPTVTVVLSTTGSSVTPVTPSGLTVTLVSDTAGQHNAGVSFQYQISGTLPDDPNRRELWLEFQHYSDEAHTILSGPRGLFARLPGQPTMPLTAGWWSYPNHRDYCDIILTPYNPEMVAGTPLVLNADILPPLSVLKAPAGPTAVKVEIEGTLAQGGGIFSANNSTGVLTRISDTTKNVGDSEQGKQSYRVYATQSWPEDQFRTGVLLQGSDWQSNWTTNIPLNGQIWETAGETGTTSDALTDFPMFESWNPMANITLYLRWRMVPYEQNNSIREPALNDTTNVAKVIIPKGAGLNLAQVDPSTFNGMSVIGGKLTPAITSVDGYTLVLSGSQVKLNIAPLASLAPGTANFYNSPAVFQTATGGPRLVFQAGLIQVDDGAGGNVLQVQPAGIIMKNGVNQLQVGPGGVSIQNGVFAMTLAAGQMQIGASTGARITVSPAAITMYANSLSAVTITTNDNVAMGLSDGSYSGFLATTWGGGFNHGIGLIGVSGSTASLWSDNGVVPISGITVSAANGMTLYGNNFTINNPSKFRDALGLKSGAITDASTYVVAPSGVVTTISSIVSNGLTLKYSSGTGPLITVDGSYVYAAGTPSGPKLLCGNGFARLSSADNSVWIAINSTGYSVNLPTTTGSKAATMTNCPAVTAQAAGWIKVFVNGATAYQPYWV